MTTTARRAGRVLITGQGCRLRLSSLLKNRCMLSPKRCFQNPVPLTDHEDGLEQIELLLTQENATHRGDLHSFQTVTSLPRPTQTPRPKFYIAATQTPPITGRSPAIKAIHQWRSRSSQ